MRAFSFFDRIPLYFWILKALELPKNEVIEYTRLKLEHTSLNNKHLQWFIDQNIVEGWDDSRLPTLRGILRRLTLATLT